MYERRMQIQFVVQNLSWEFIKENKKVRKQENKNSTKKAIKKQENKKENTFLLEFLFSCFLS